MVATSDNWDEIEHAYGFASDIPQLLVALTSPKQQVRSVALDELEDKLYHQGHRYDATLAALPALMDVLAVPDGPDRSRMITFLSYIAVQYPDKMVHSTDWSELESDPCFNGVRDSLESAARLLTDRNEGVRAAALGLLANVPPKDPGAVRAVLDDKSTLIRGLAVLALGRWAVHSGQVASILPEIEKRAKKGKGNEKVLAAATWLQVAPSQASFDTALARLPKKANLTKHFPFFEGSMFLFVVGVLTRAPAELSDQGSRLLDALKKLLSEDTSEASEIVEACIEAFFGDHSDSSVGGWLAKAPEDLSSAQLRFLRLVAKGPGLGSVSRGMLRDRALPLSTRTEMPDDLRAVLLRYLGDLPEEREFLRFPAPFGGQAWPLYKWMRAAVLKAADERALEARLVEANAEQALEGVLCLSGPSPDIYAVPDFDPITLLHIGLNVLRRRDDVVPLIMPRLRRESVDRSSPRYERKRVFAPLAFLSEFLAGQEQVLPADVDDVLPFGLEPCASPWTIGLVRNVVARLPRERRDRVVERARLEEVKTQSASAEEMMLDGWSILDLHSDTCVVIEKAIRGIRKWIPFMVARIHPEFRARVLQCLRALGEDVIPAIEAALTNEPEKGDKTLKEFLDELRGSSP